VRGRQPHPSRSEPGIYTKIHDGWLRAGFDAWCLGIEATSVVGLRVAKIAAGGSVGSAEAMLMVSEKVQAGADLQTAFASGQLGPTPLAGLQTALRYFRRKVMANKRRLKKEASDALARGRR
jgi:hypothetical protein